MTGLSAAQQGPHGAGVSVGQGRGGNLHRLAGNQFGQPWQMGRPAPPGMADNRHRSGNQKPPQILIALPGYASQPPLAACRSLSWHQPDPGGELTA